MINCVPSCETASCCCFDMNWDEKGLVDCIPFSRDGWSMIRETDEPLALYY